MDNSNNGYLIFLRYVMRLLLDECKGSGKASELEVYSYLFYHANFSLFPEKVKKGGGICITANKGQIAISCEDLAQYFKVARNTINSRLNALIRKGIITKCKNANVCNVYEIVSFGATKFMIEQPQNVDISNDLNENSNAVEQPKAIFEQPIEQPIEQPKTQKVEQPQNVDISNENGNFSKGIEQPQNVAKNGASSGNIEQPYLINESKVNKDSLIPTTMCLRDTREKNFLDSVRDDEKFIPLIQKELNIERDYLIEMFDKFYVEQLEQNKQYSNTDDAKWHFRNWLNAILKESYGTEIFNTFKDFSTQPKRLLYPLCMLSKKQKAEYAMMFNLDESQFDVILNEYLKTANEYRFKSFTEELQKLQFYVNNSDLQF